MRGDSMRRLAARTALMTGAAWLGVLAPANAQTTSAAPGTVEEIVVTGTRLNVTGYQAPTPVTVVGLEKLQTDAQTDVISVLTDLPSVGPSASPNSSNGQQNISAGLAGLSLVNLRNLGTARTLVLYDGIRVAPSVVDGGTDVNLLPSSLIQRIDVVTGGASAAWGSDAIAGVINIVLNKQFSGWAAHIEGATNQSRIHQQGKMELSYGRDVLGGRGHVIVSGSYTYSPDIVIASQFPWYKSQALVNNPRYTPTNAEPRLIHAERVGMANALQGGLISTGPLVTPSGWITFDGQSRPQLFQPGSVSGPLTVGGTFSSGPQNGQATSLSAAIKSTQLFGYFSYDLTDDITASLELDYGRSFTQNSHNSYVRANNVPIQIDNAYLDPSLVTRMQQLGINSFNLGTTNSNNYVLGDDGRPSHGLIGTSTLGKWNTEVVRVLTREVFTINGPLRFLGDWKWNVDLQHSKVDRHTDSNSIPIVLRYNQAVDSVRVTAANVGTSGLAIGSIACRALLSADAVVRASAQGCVPLNVLGINVASQQAISWISGYRPWSDLILQQYTASAAFRGTAFEMPAGPVAVALGVDYRYEDQVQKVDPLTLQRIFAVGNQREFDVHQSSIEGFGEIGVPLLKDSFVQSLDLNAAARYIHYSTSGGWIPWKVGLTSQLTDDVRLRATLSKDIHQPGLSSLFNPGSESIQVIADPLRNNTPTNITSLTSGNPNLKPEVGKTITVGAVFTPRFIPRFSASIDYYAIDLKDAFATPNQNLILQNCTLGDQQYCALTVRNAQGVLVNILLRPINAASNKISGLDVALDYSHPVGNGSVFASLVGNRIYGDRTDSLGNISYYGGVKIKATAAAGYRDDRFSGTVQVRGLGTRVINNIWTPKDVDDNGIPEIAYLDLRASYKVDEARRITAYIAIDNVLNEDPPIVPGNPTGIDVLTFPPIDSSTYEFMGRQYRFGLRARF